ncbi:unnamed protein product [Cylindrotheca closterium]|uniref:Right handed beta helix domain-containing protein n=1 Tax=Cylindrotheca closterium TaxID=2856 RepID=A0AAD2FGW8_9STRA|nr:unnamed protein product [Cylindrotheca closterium]
MSLVQQPQPVEATQSRPVPQNLASPKSPSLLKRMMSARSSRMSALDSSSFSLDDSERFMLPPSTSTALTSPLPARFFRPKKLPCCDPSSSDLMEWLQGDCPQDLLPKILAFAGPQMVSKLSQTNRFWNALVSQEQTWRTLSEELYKWTEEDETPSCWRDYYRYNPCVPVDFPSITRALASATTHKHLQNRSVRVLMRPGRYILKEPITVEANHGVSVTVETMDLPDSFNHVIEYPNDEKPKKRKTSLRKLLSCRTVDADDEDEPPLEFPERSSEFGMVLGKNRAVLTLRCKKHNQPLVKVRRGSCVLRNLELRHITYGLDIWNGNAAVQIQPPLSPDEQPIPVAPMPTAVLDHVDVTSESGRGVVNIDGGDLSIRNCYIHDCAATGVYVGAAASKLTIQNTDVVRNGNGNRQHRRGIARGHSGIYLEQGLAEINNSSISQNCLTGISAVSPSNAILHLSESELVSNGSTQLEMPDIGTLAQRNSSTRDVHLSNVDSPRLRSALVEEVDSMMSSSIMSSELSSEFSI